MEQQHEQGWSRGQGKGCGQGWGRGRGKAMDRVVYTESMSSNDSSDAESNERDEGCGLLSADKSSDVDGTSVESDDYLWEFRWQTV